MVDYSNLYNGYWKRSDRLGESSFDDPKPVVRQILSTCGNGRLLDAGSGMGALVRELLYQGADAYGLDVSTVAVEHCNQYAPGRFVSGSLLDLPFPDASFDAVISTDCLEHLSPEDVAIAFREMRRVCKRALFLRVATGPDRDGLWHLTIQPRSWWENLAFEHGFRKHPAYYQVNPYESLEYDGYTITIPLEKIPDEVLEHYPLSALRAERDLHMDMLRETGRRSDAHVHRYQLAASLVRPGDMVVDAACGMGYGSYLLAYLTPCGTVLGMDLSEGAAAYGTAMFAARDSRIRYAVGDVQDLSRLPDASIDLLVSFETLEHIPAPETFLGEAVRVLKPGGRLIVSVPNRWMDDTGKDPNPWHLHVYDWDKLASQLSRSFLLEQAYGETAGGGMRLSKGPRELFAFDPELGPQKDCEWLILVAIRDPREGKGMPYEEQMYGEEERPPNLIEFGRDYLNPYLAHAMVSIPWRLKRTGLLTKLAEDVRGDYPKESPDFAAAVCTLAYQALGNPDTDAETIKRLTVTIAEIVAAAPANPHYFRWQISTSYVAGLLCLKIGDHENAITWFDKCANMDCRDFSPTLATKTISAAWQAGRLLVGCGRNEDATKLLNRGVDTFFSVFAMDKTALLGKSKRPFDFPYFEFTEVAAAMTNCVNLLRDIHSTAPGRSSILPVENLQFVVRRMEAQQRQSRDEIHALINKNIFTRALYKLYKAVKRRRA